MSQRRIEIGMQGGSVLGLTVEEADATALTAGLRAGGWHEVVSDGHTYSVNAEQVQYVRVVAGDPGARVGFGE